MCASDDIYSEKGMKYGGVDAGGVKDPEARESIGVDWDDWEEW